jgi:hypothetical protein
MNTVNALAEILSENYWIQDEHYRLGHLVACY